MTGFWCPAPRDVLVVTGDDAESYIQGQISQDIGALVPGSSVYTFVLQPTGKVESLARITDRTPDELWIDTDAGYGPALLARLNRFRIRVKVDIAALDVNGIAVRGVAERPASALPAWGRPDAFDLLGDGCIPPDGVREGTSADLELARIEAGWPAMGREITEATIPAETGVVPFAVNFTKGCYPGQELVERMDSRGSQAPRFVRRIRGNGTVSVGAEVLHGGKVAGQLTSVASTLRGWVALAPLVRSVQPGDVVQIGSTSGTVSATA